MEEEQPVLNFSLKEDLPSQSYCCNQVLDGSIFYDSNCTPSQLFVVTHAGHRINGDTQILDGLDFLEIQVKDNNLCFSMLDYRDKEREDWSRRCFEVSVRNEKLVWKEINKIPYDEKTESFPFSPHIFQVKSSTLLIRDLHQSVDEKPVKEIEMPCAIEDVHKVFFKNILFIVRNGRKVEIKRKSVDVVDIQIPFDVLRDKLNVHCYSDLSVLHIVNIGHDFLLALNIDHLSYRISNFHRPSSCPFTTFDYSVGVRDDILTVCFFDEITNKGQLWTARIP